MQCLERAHWFLVRKRSFEHPMDRPLFVDAGDRQQAASKGNINLMICQSCLLFILFTFLQSWKTARPTEMMNEKNDSCRALNALMPRIPRPSGTNVMAFNRTKVKIGIAIFFNFDLRDSLGALASLNLRLKSISSLWIFLEEMVTFVSAIGNFTDTSFFCMKLLNASKMSDVDRPSSWLFRRISTSPNICNENAKC